MQLKGTFAREHILNPRRTSSNYDHFIRHASQVKESSSRCCGALRVRDQALIALFCCVFLVFALLLSSGLTVCHLDAKRALTTPSDHLATAAGGRYATFGVTPCPMSASLRATQPDLAQIFSKCLHGEPTHQLIDDPVKVSNQLLKFSKLDTPIENERWIFTLHHGSPEGTLKSAPPNDNIKTIPIH
jgi:hypothetical protein